MKYRISPLGRNRYRVQFMYAPSKSNRGAAVIAKVLDPAKGGRKFDHCGQIKGQVRNGLSLSIEVSVGEVIAFGFYKNSSGKYTAAERAIVQEDGTLLICDKNYAKFYITSTDHTLSGELRDDGRQVISIKYPVGKGKGLPFIARVDKADFKLNYDGGTIIILEKGYNCVVMAKPGDIVIHGQSDRNADQTQWNLCIVRHDMSLHPIGRAEAALHLA